MLMPVIEDVRAKAGLTQADIGFTCSGSTDYLSGQAFSFVSTLDGIGPWPPIQESHVEMDGAFALYEAWVKLQLGDVDTALVYCYGKSAPGPIHEVLSRQLDPYHVAPLWPDADQPRRPAGPGAARRRQGHARRTSPRSPPAAAATPRRTRTPSWRGTARSRTTSTSRYLVDPLRKERLPADHRRRLRGGPRRRRPGPRAPRAPGVDPGHRPPHRADGARPARPHRRRPRPGRPARRPAPTGAFDVAELHAPFSPQELILREALGLGDHGQREPVGRRAGRQPGDGRRPHPHRRGGPADHGRHRQPGRRPRHLRSVPPAEPRLRPRRRGADGQGAGRRHRDRADQAPGHPRRRVDGRPRPRGRVPGPRRTPR